MMPAMSSSGGRPFYAGGALPSRPTFNVPLMMQPPRVAVPRAMPTPTDRRLGRQLRVAVIVALAFAALSSPPAYRLLQGLLSVVWAQYEPLISAETGAVAPRGVIYMSLVMMVVAFVAVRRSLS